MEKQKLLKEFDSFAKSLKKSDNIAVCYHADADGMASCLVIDKAINKLLGKRVLTYPRHNPAEAINLELVNELEERKVNKVIFADLSFAVQRELIQDLTEFAEVLIIDHHKIYEELNSEKVVFINALYIEEKIPPSNYPACKMCYDLFSRIVSLKEIEWIVLFGLKGDVSEKHWKKFVAKAHKKFPDKLIIFLLDSLSAIAALSPKDFENVYKQFFEAKNPKALMKSDLGKYVKEYKQLISLWLQKIKKEAEVFKDIELVFYNMGKEKRSIKSFLVDEVKKLFPGKTIILLQDKGNGFSTMSARREDGKIKVNNLLERAVKDLDHSAAGGHDPAAGGIILTEDIEQFKKNVIRLLKAKYEGKGTE
ncbi:MAG: DHH family phosphoesterase [archaeon]|nr:DHH family phosphoesterase [archaeon]